MKPTTIIGRQHLNIFNPLWQGVLNLDDVFHNLSRKERFTTLLHGADDITRSYYYALRDEFFGLKNSPNIALRAYYNARREPVLAALAEASAKRAAVVLKDLMCGCEKVVHLHARPGSYYVSFGSLCFRISGKKYPEIVQGMTVFIQGIVYEGRASACYCTKTEESDPARRFCLKITGLSFSRPFTYFVQAGGDITTQEINGLTDLLDGHKKEDIINRPRRLLPWRFDPETFQPKKIAKWENTIAGPRAVPKYTSEGPLANVDRN